MASTGHVRAAAACAAALGAGVLVAGPAQAHVTVSPDTATAGAFTIATISVPHGCDGSATTRVAVQIPEQILSVTPTRNPLYDVDKLIVALDEPIQDAHGNTVTERVGQVVYTARTPLPDGYRDAFELSFQVPDTPGETLVFPTIQTCEKGQTAWTEVASDGQDPESLEHPAPTIAVTAPAERDGADATDVPDAAAAPDADDAVDSGSPALGWAGLVLGALGLVAGGTALARSRRT
ncbi:MAG TPA: YcnI family protein [Marmoricola sp.]|nr:YcnI family protein [Marmoricola sp.]